MRATLPKALAVRLALACAGILAAGAHLGAATASYPVDAFFLPSSQSAQLQVALDQNQVVRLDHGRYDTGGLASITLRAGQRLYGLKTIIPPVVVAPGTTGAVLSSVIPGTLTFPASSLATAHNFFKSVTFSAIVGTGATLEANLFVDLANDTIAFDTSGGGHLIDNRFVRTLGQGGSHFITVTGDSGHASQGNVFLWMNMLGPTPVVDGYVRFRDLADVTLVGVDYECSTTTTAPAIQADALGAYRQYVWSGIAPAGTPLKINAAEMQVHAMTMSANSGTDIEFAASNLRSLIGYATRATLRDLSTAAPPFRLHGFDGGVKAVANAGTVLSSAASSALADPTPLVALVAPTRSAVPWERPVFAPVPDPGGPAWNVGLVGQPDSRATIQALIDSAAAAGDFARLPAGTYYISGPLHLGAGNGLIGAGMDRTLIVAKTPNIDMVVGDGSTGLNLTDLTLQGGANGIHHQPEDLPVRAQFFGILLSHVTFRDMANAGIFIDRIYAWDNDFVDHVNFVNCPSGFKQHPNLAEDFTLAASNQICYLDKVLFYGCQFSGCGTALDLPANRPNNLNMCLDCSFTGSTSAVATMVRTNSQIFANCTFSDNAGNPTISSTSNLDLLSCDFQAGSRGTAMIFAPGQMHVEGCTFARAGNPSATIVASTGFASAQKFFSNCTSTDMPIGGISTNGLFLHNQFGADTAFSGLGVSQVGATVKTFASAAGIPAPAPQFLVGSVFPAQLVDAIAGVVPPGITLGAPVLAAGRSAVKSGDSATIAITYAGAATVT
nr:hypothetical protein [Planctomycetota bacterium]